MKKPPPILTPRIIADLRAGEECVDPDHLGLRVRRTNAARVFFYRYRSQDSVLRQIKLGEFGPMTLAEARKALGRLKLERERGIDPQLQKQQARTEARRRREAEKLARYTVGKLVEHYIDECLSKQKRGDEGARMLRRELVAKLGDRAAAAVTRRELLDVVIRPILSRAPRCGTYLLGRIRCAYTHAADQGRLPDEFVLPTLGIKGAPQVRRKRVFSDAELATFVRWLPGSSYSRTVRDALALVLLTACRSGEVVGALWRDIDLERAVWSIRETKNGEPHDVMLPRQAIDLLRARRALHDVYAFPSPMDGHYVAQKALGLAQYEARKEKEGRSRIDPIEITWTVHDLRRTAATAPGQARLPARRAGSHPQSRRQFGKRDLRPASLRRRGACVAAEVGGLSGCADRGQRRAVACGVTHYGRGRGCFACCPASSATKRAKGVMLA